MRESIDKIDPSKDQLTDTNKKEVTIIELPHPQKTPNGADVETTSPVTVSKFFEQADSFLQNAEKETNLSDWGTKRESVVECVEALLRNFDLQPPKVNEANRQTVYELLTERLRLMKEINDNRAEIESQEIASPTFIIGLPRVGSTFLHRIMNDDALNRSPYAWEMLHPESGTVEKRIARARFCLRRLFGPPSEHVHPTGEDLVEECPHIMRLHFYYYVFMSMPGDYLDWFFADTERQIEMYRFHKLAMQLFQWQQMKREGKVSHSYWTFKAPLHSPFLYAISQVYPDAKFIWLHRNPNLCMSSLQTLYDAVFNELSSMSEEYKKSLSEQQLRFRSLSIKRAMSDVENYQLDSKHKFIHGYYDNLVKNPEEFVKMIYRELGRECTPAFDEVLRKYTEKERCRVFKEHAQYRIAFEVLEKEYQEYNKKFFGKECH